MTRCVKTDLEPEQCAHCRGLDLPKMKEHQPKTKTTAKFDGFCADCNGRIRIDDPIYPTADGFWICGECAGDETC